MPDAHFVTYKNGSVADVLDKIGNSNSSLSNIKIKKVPAILSKTYSLSANGYDIVLVRYEEQLGLDFDSVDSNRLIVIPQRVSIEQDDSTWKDVEIVSIQYYRARVDVRVKNLTTGNVTFNKMDCIVIQW